MIFDILSDREYETWADGTERTEVRDVSVRYAADVADWQDYSDDDLVSGLAEDWQAEVGGTSVVAESGTGSVVREAGGSVVVSATLHVLTEYGVEDRFDTLL